MQENSELILFRRVLNPRTTLGLNTSHQRSSSFQPKPDCRSTGTVDRPPVDPVGRPNLTESLAHYSQGLSVDRAGRPPKALCMLCMSVDRSGRPTLPDSAAAAIFCCCPLCLPSSTSLAISSMRPMAIQQSSQLPM